MECPPMEEEEGVMNILTIAEIPEIGGEMKGSAHPLTEGAVMTGISPLQSDHVWRRKMIAPDLEDQRETEHSSLNELMDYVLVDARLYIH